MTGLLRRQTQGPLADRTHEPVKAFISHTKPITGKGNSVRYNFYLWFVLRDSRLKLNLLIN